MSSPTQLYLPLEAKTKEFVVRDMYPERLLSVKPNAGMAPSSGRVFTPITSPVSLSNYRS